jgi:hypothetical protein
MGLTGRVPSIDTFRYGQYLSAMPAISFVAYDQVGVFCFAAPKEVERFDRPGVGRQLTLGAEVEPRVSLANTSNVGKAAIGGEIQTRHAAGCSLYDHPAQVRFLLKNW